ncbi:cell division protein SepF [Mechercharimyces sp. CAU 1602]|uniref:cell division protein SepF n=1 Tax=Mechercharimyces sp. CAU 1602 TaxID=2973933 RepID=UPI002867EBAD|nr:cell division protein SepF [Mechercharimyces sp. CAU 1602]
MTEYVEDPEERMAATAKKRNVVSIHSQKNIRVVLVEPRTYDEVQEIADHLKSHRPVVVNLQLIQRDTAMRFVDFLSGTVYALGGNIQKLGSHIFFCTPANVDIQGNMTDFLKNEMTNDWLR